MVSTEQPNLAEKDEQEARQEWLALTCGGQVSITVKVKPYASFWLPDPQGECSVNAIFRLMNYEDYAVIEDLVATERVVDAEHKIMARELDYTLMRWYMMRRVPLSWNLDIPLIYENGWLKEDCFARIKKLPAPLVQAMLDQYEPHISVTDDEEHIINRQSNGLFSEHSRGILHACKAVSLYCTLSTFWEKFGLNKFDIGKLPYREYLMLRMMVANDNEATRRRMATKKSQDSAPSFGNRRGKVVSRKPFFHG